MTFEERIAADEAKRQREIADAREFELARDEAARKHATEADARHHERVKERDAIIQDRTDKRTDAMMREQTAATILAALIGRNGMPTNADSDLPRRAVALTDALRAALAKGGGQ